MKKPTYSVEMEDLLHRRPPLPLSARGKRFLHRVHDGPPLLSFRVLAHSAHVRSHILTDVFEVAEEHALSKEDRVIADVALGDLPKNFGPHGLVVLLVREFRFRPKRTLYHSVALNSP
jgi:hypothetical protein